MVDGLDRDLLQQELVYRSIGTAFFGGDRLQSTDAAPDDGLAGIAEYELTKVLREEFKSSLPTVEEIENELSE